MLKNFDLQKIHPMRQRFSKSKSSKIWNVSRCFSMNVKCNLNLRRILTSHYENSIQEPRLPVEIYLSKLLLRIMNQKIKSHKHHLHQPPSTIILTAEEEHYGHFAQDCFRRHISIANCRAGHHQEPDGVQVVKAPWYLNIYWRLSEDWRYLKNPTWFCPVFFRIL